MSRTQSSVEANLLLNNLDGFSVAYTNHKGVELPLKNVKDLSEAIKSAKCKGQNHLNLIFYDHNLKSHEATALNNGKCASTGKFSKNQSIEIPCINTVSCNSFKAEKVFENSPPEWFKQYMKKLKKEILKDLRSSIAQILHEEFEKQKKMTEEKLIESLPDKNELSTTKLRKKRRKSCKNSLDRLEKREVKLLKKIEMLRSSKFDRMMSPVLQLEKLENKAKALVDEKIKLLERGCENKSRNVKKTKEPEKQPTIKKSAIFRESDVFFFLQPGAEFSVTVDILNNGTVPWVSPRMECLDAPAIYLKEHLINLPRLEPGHTVSATLRGKVSHRLGNYYFLYQLFDGLKEFAGPLFACFAVVSDSKEEVISNSEQVKPDNKTIPTRNLVGSLIDFEKDVIASSQKKIRENIIEIERRLQDIDLLRLCTIGDESREARSNNNGGEFETTCCDLLQGEEIKCWKERLQKGMIFGVDPLQQKEETEKSKQMDENFKSGSSHTKINGTEGDSDSELSIIFVSEEEENFFFLPLFPESSNSETVNNRTKLSKFDLNKNSNRANQKLKKDIAEERDVKVELKESGREEISTLKNSLPRPSR